MAKPPTLSLKIEDFGKLVQDYPEFEALIRNLNRFATGVSGSLNRGTTFADNIASQEAVLEFDTDGSSSVLNAPLKLVLKLPAGRKPAHVTVTRASTVDLNTRLETPVSLGNPAWSVDGSSLVVSTFGLLAASKHYRVTLLVVGG